MHFFKKLRILSGLSATFLMVMNLSACNQITAESHTSTTTSSSSIRFASGTKGVKINTYVTNSYSSFSVPTTTPTTIAIPSTLPGYDGSSLYNPGVSAANYYDLDGSTGITKPSWLLDFQMGISSSNASGACAGFGTGLNSLDPANFYRVSEYDCGGATAGNGGGFDPAFFRIVLNRDTSVIGSGENLLIQVEYQASGLHLNSDGTQANAEDNLDQLWKIYWNSSLNPSDTPKPFGIFIPPNYSACKSSGTGSDGPGNCPHGTPNAYRGSPVKTRQFIIPLSAYPNMKVIQFSRKSGRKGGPDDYVSAFCATNEPLCLGVVIRSVTLMRM